MQGSGYFLDSRVLRDNQVKSSGDEVNVRIDLGSLGNDGLYSGCAQPTTSTMPSAVLMASDSSFNSLVPGASDIKAIR